MKYTHVCLIIALVIFTVLGCKKSTNSNAVTPSLSLDKTSFNQYEVATLTASNIIFSQSSYDGTLGGQAIKLGVSQNKVGFIVPELAQGSYALQTTIEGIPYSFTINVTALQTINNPNAFIQSSLATYLSDSTYLNNLVSITSGMPGADNNKANAVILMNYGASFRNTLNTATTDQVMQMAKNLLRLILIFFNHWKMFPFIKIH